MVSMVKRTDFEGTFRGDLEYLLAAYDDLPEEVVAYLRLFVEEIERQDARSHG